MAKKDRQGLHFGIHLTRFAWYALEKKFPGALYVHIVEAVAEYLREKTGYPLASVRKWLVEGDVRGDHPFTKSSFVFLMREWGGKVPGLQTRTDIEHFAGLGKPEYLVALAEKDFREFLATLKPGPLSPYWQNQLDYLIALAPALPSEYLSRPDIEPELLEKAEFCIENHQPLLIHGAAGAGKSTLMSWLYWHKFAVKEFGFERMWIAGDNALKLPEWFSLLHRYYYSLPEKAINQATIISDLKRAWGQSKWLLMLDDCTDMEFVEMLMPHLPSGSLLAVTSRSEFGLKEFFAPQNRIDVKQVNEQNALSIYRRLVLPVSEKNRDWVRAMNDACAGNLLAMKIAFALAIQTSQHAEILHSFQASQRPAIQTALDNFSRLGEADLIPAFHALGALLSMASYDLACFQGLWDVSAEEARTRLEQLVSAGLVERETPGDKWHIHPAVLEYAHERMGDTQKKQQEAWLKRYSQVPEQEEYFRRFSVVTPVLKFENALARSDLLGMNPTSMLEKWIISPFKRLFPGKNNDWQMMRRHSAKFSSDRLAIGYVLNEQASRRLKFAFGAVLMGAITLNFVTSALRLSALESLVVNIGFWFIAWRIYLPHSTQSDSMLIAMWQSPRREDGA